MISSYVSQPKGLAITITSLLFYIIGTLGIIVSIVSYYFLYILIGGLIGSFPVVGALVEFVSQILVGVLAFMIALSLLRILSGYYLWKSLRVGGILVIIVSIISILIGLIIFILLYTYVNLLIIIINLVIIALIAIGWKELR
ncbi:MAG: hypothetical protein QXR45_15115 [Candidatus Bathyarchaeia archaeon]